jgi:hypothetical protein
MVFATSFVNIVPISEALETVLYHFAVCASPRQVKFIQILYQWFHQGLLT